MFSLDDGGRGGKRVPLLLRKESRVGLLSRHRSRAVSHVLKSFVQICHDDDDDDVWIRCMYFNWRSGWQSLEGLWAISALVMVTGGWFMALYGVAALDLDVLLYEHGYGVTF
jgi:hypothetical protein